jgi:ABC-type branched-subunit amino acid transport system ATPase component
MPPPFTTRLELRGTFGAIASTHWLASAAGMAVLERGALLDAPDLFPHQPATIGVRTYLAEQNATWALSLASRSVIIDRGRVKMTGAAALLDDPEVRRAYLGV